MPEKQDWDKKGGVFQMMPTQDSKDQQLNRRAIISKATNAIKSKLLGLKSKITTRTSGKKSQQKQQPEAANSGEKKGDTASSPVSQQDAVAEAAEDEEDSMAMDGAQEEEMLATASELDTYKADEEGLLDDFIDDAEFAELLGGDEEFEKSRDDENFQTLNDADDVEPSQQVRSFFWLCLNLVTVAYP